MTKGAEILCLVICFLVGYFAGSISPATVAGKMYGIDIRKEGSGNPGTTNVLRTLGKKAAAVTLVIDVLKGYLPAAAAGLLVSETALIAAATGAILGHMWPVFFHFKGGKGVATTFGAIMAFDWRVGLFALVFALLGVFLTKRVSCGSIAASIAFPIAAYLFINRFPGSLGWEYLWAAALGILIIWRHRSNIMRLIKGEEPPLGLLSRKK